MKPPRNNFLVVDLEATCWETIGQKGTQPNEIIEVGYVVVDLISLTIIENESIMVIPTTTTVSEFCTKLTTIKPEDVTREAGATSFGEACQEMRKLITKHSIYSWGSYGDYDRSMFAKQSTKESFINPMPKKHINISHMVELINGGQKIGMDKALKLFNLSLHGTHHRGKDDAFNINEILCIILSNNRPYVKR